MGIMSSIVIPLVLQGMKQRQENSITAQKQTDALELENARSANAIAETQAKGVQDRLTAREQSSLSSGRFRNEYWPRFAQGIATGVAGGIASGAAKGYFTQKFKSDGTNKKDGNNNKRPPSGPSAAPVFGQFSAEQIQKTKDWLSQKQATPQFARESKSSQAPTYDKYSDRLKSREESEFIRKWNLDERGVPHSMPRSGVIVAPGIIAPAITLLTAI